jgi:Ca-activated chloride channel family protein
MNDLLTTFAEFHFLRPLWLWAILPLLIMGGLLAYLNKQQSGWQSVLAGHLYKHIVSHANGKKLRKPLWLLTLGWIIATLALAGPTWQRLPQPVFQLHNGKVVLLDMSMSMRATDIKPNRLTRAKYKAIDLVKQISEGETGLVAYAGDAFTISPLSSDGQNLTMLIPSLSPEIMPIAGSDPALGLQAAIALLQNANYPQGEIFWITDGIDNRQMKEMSELLNASPYRLSVLAVGTEEGAPIQMQNGELLKDNNGAIVLPKLTTSNLKILAKQGDGRYAPMQADNSDIEYLLAQNTLGTDEEQADDDTKKGADDNFGDKWQEMGPYLLLLLLPFAAYSFRRGLLGMMLLGLLLPVYTPEANAFSLQESWQDMWQTNNQQGLEAFEKQQFDEAAQKFDDPLWQGSALYKNKDYENALKAFSQVDSPQGRYNQANTLAQLGKLPEALKKYDEVLTEQPDNEDAQANKALVEKLLEQQESEQQKSDQNQQQDADQQQDKDQQKDQQEQDGEQSEQQNSDQQQQENESEGDSSEQEQNQQDEQQPQSEEQEQQESKSEESKESGSKEGESKESEQEAQAQKMQEKELTDEEKEQMQRMQNLLNKVPDDPAFLLKRKMQIEAQQRKRERAPGNLQRNW